MSGVDVVRLDAAAVDHVAVLRGPGAEPLAQPRPDVGVRLAGLLRRGVPARADRPDRLVGEHERPDLVARQAVEGHADLPVQHRERLARLALLERLADADDRAEPAPSAAINLWLTASSVSWNSRRRSEWPMMTYSAPASFSMPALISPVNAPSRSQCRFCPATPTGVLRAASATACSAVNGGATTISTSVTSFTTPRISLMNTTASWTVLNIFQLAAMKGVRMVCSLLRATCYSATSPRCHVLRGRLRLPVANVATWPRVYVASAATPGSVRPPRNSSDAPPPVETCEMRSVTPAFATAAIESPPPMTVVPFTAATAWATASVPERERVDLEHAHGTVPDHGLRAGDDLAVGGRGLRADVEPHPVADRLVADVSVSVGIPASSFAATTWSDGSSSRRPRAFAGAPHDLARRVEQVLLDERLADGHTPAP
jgi:hypothetical protein